MVPAQSQSTIGVVSNDLSSEMAWIHARFHARMVADALMPPRIEKCRDWVDLPRRLNQSGQDFQVVLVRGKSRVLYHGSIDNRILEVSI